jgi:uncharacterized protein (TIGR03435 family)
MQLSLARPLILLVTVASALSSALSQTASTRLTFEVATIRTSQATDRTGGIKPLPGGNGYSAVNIPVKLMISLMYRVPMSQLEGGPAWLDSDRYDIKAKSEQSYDIEDLHVMYQNLLADRFNLKFHKETREGSVYALTLDTPGSKMKANDSPQDYKIPMNFGPNGVIGIRVPMPYFCWWLGQQVQSSKRPIIDLTGLTKNYDFNISFAPELPPDVSKETLPPELRDRPSIFDALKQQLGLKLTPQRGPVEHYIIDHIDRPSDN